VNLPRVGAQAERLVHKGSELTLCKPGKKGLFAEDQHQRWFHVPKGTCTVHWAERAGMAKGKTRTLTGTQPQGVDGQGVPPSSVAAPLPGSMKILP
jgi:hypothetical protein